MSSANVPSTSTLTSQMLNKVPIVTLTFWIVKILSTTVGETAADYLAVDIGIGKLTTDLITLALLIGALLLQLRARTYVPWRYWLVVVLLSIVGTQITDALTDSLGIDLWFSTGVFTVVLIGIFLVWHASEGTLSIQSITTRRREYFYWAAILFTFALGTAAGDLATEALGLGFTVGVGVFAGLIAAIAVAHKLGTATVPSFWLAYILTRPLGASLGDLLAQAKTYGGLGLGTVMTSAVFLLVIVALVSHMTLLHRREAITSGSRSV